MDNLPPLVDVPAPTCNDCPYSLKDAASGYTYCRRFPPVARDVPVPVGSLPRAQQIMLPKEALAQGFVMTHQSGFPPVVPGMVCGEHPDFDLGEDDSQDTATH